MSQPTGPDPQATGSGSGSGENSDTSGDKLIERLRSWFSESWSNLNFNFNFTLWWRGFSSNWWTRWPSYLALTITVWIAGQILWFNPPLLSQPGWVTLLFMVLGATALGAAFWKDADYFSVVLVGCAAFLALWYFYFGYHGQDQPVRVAGALTHKLTGEEVYQVEIHNDGTSLTIPASSVFIELELIPKDENPDTEIVLRQYGPRQALLIQYQVIAANASEVSAYNANPWRYDRFIAYEKYQNLSEGDGTPIGSTGVEIPWDEIELDLIQPDSKN